MSVDPKDRPVQCFVPIPTEILINGSQMDVRSMRCPERIPLGELMCSAHWALLDKDKRQALIQSQRFHEKQGLTIYSNEWKRIADAAVKAVFRTLIETKLKEKRENAAPTPKRHDPIAAAEALFQK